MSGEPTRPAQEGSHSITRVQEISPTISYEYPCVLATLYTQPTQQHAEAEGGELFGGEMIHPLGVAECGLMYPLGVAECGCAVGVVTRERLSW